jgi:ketosteroid isomerase-like protein
METPRWVDALFRTIDGMDADGFVSYLTEDAKFRYGNLPEVAGRDKIREAAAALFETVQRLEHRLLAVWTHPDSVICQGEVTYLRKDGGRITLPFMNLFMMKDGRIDRYLVYVDAGPLLRPDP